MCITLGAKVLARLVIYVEVAILRTELALARSFLAMAQVARVALRQAIRVAPTDGD